MAVSTIKNETIVTETKGLVVKFNNSSTKEVIINVAKDGYAPIGVVGYNIITSANFYVLRAFVDNNQLYFYLVQRAGTAVTMDVNVSVLIAYQPNQILTAQTYRERYGNKHYKRWN